MKNIVSYGAGTNSTALLVGLVNFGYKVDAIVFSDTGGERPATYAYIAYFSKWLQSKGFPEIVTTRYTNEKGESPTLEEYILERKVLPPISYGFKSCSDKFKQRPFNRWVKSQYPGELINVFVGFDAGEPQRVKDNTVKGFTNVYKLIEWGWNRERCTEEISKAGLCLPGKSACFFCRNTKKQEIFDLSPDLRERAIRIEQNAKPNLNELKGLAGAWSWESLINGGQQSTLDFDDNEPDIPCGCMD